MSEHICDEKPKDYHVLKLHGSWVARDDTYKYMDCLKNCPFCGEVLDKKSSFSIYWEG